MEAELLREQCPETSTASYISWAAAFLSPKAPRSLPPYLERAPPSPRISGDTGSSRAFDRAVAWFEACASRHGACGGGFRSAPMPLLPSRIIDITGPHSLRLVDTGNEKSGHYFILSHRWLDAREMPRCLRSNLAALTHRIPLESLTPTFQDAISLARNRPMPIRYIWIDSLCIVQDSPDDWLREAARMGSYYRNAILTIAAAAGDVGLFAGARRDAEADTPLDLLTRGWVLQERLLSRRFLIFGPHELIWECMESRDCECGVLAYPAVIAADRSGGLEYFAKLGRDLAGFWEGKHRDDPNDAYNPLPVKIAFSRAVREDKDAGPDELVASGGEPALLFGSDQGDRSPTVAAGTSIAILRDFGNGPKDA
ncbi:hypothetical protein B0T24DRAFT_521123 [Lasiosphaeria ovina]|uniref:Heterokaryon incompatibility domain-containing protein n=1 Tax=Lasiosphaeria ovina TaxID=92902 RepID=A0AAE0NE06_9PEZI|nr:hypothetical protein B0T24DRAFT_521123 [Lasiosphaeria ovina]